MKTLFIRFVKDELGVTAIEYGLIAGLISVVILVAVTAIGTSLQGVVPDYRHRSRWRISRGSYSGPALRTQGDGFQLVPRLGPLAVRN